MGLDASTSLGAAIGLTGQPKDYSIPMAGLAQKQQTIGVKAQEAAAKRAEKDAIANAKMFEIKPGKYLPTRTEAVRKKVAEFYETIRNAKRNGVDPKQDQEVLQSLADTTGYLKGLEQEHIFYNKDYSKHKAKPQDYKFNDEDLNLYAGKEQIGDDVPLYLEGKGISFNGDLNKKFAEYGKAAGQNIRIEETLNPDGSQNMEKYQQVLDVTNNSIAKKWLEQTKQGNSPHGDLIMKTAVEKIKLSPGYDLMSDEEKMAALDKSFVDEAVKGMKDYQLYSESKTVTPAPKPSVTNINMGSGENGADQYKQRMDEASFGYPTVTENNKIAPHPEKQGAVKFLASSYPLSFKAGDYKVPASEKILDLKTLTPAATRGNLEITGGYVGTVPVYKKGIMASTPEYPNRKGDLAGIPVDKNDLYQAEKDNLVEYKSVFIGDGIDDNGEKHQVFFETGSAVQKAGIMKESKGDQPKVKGALSETERVAVQENERLRLMHVGKKANTTQKPKENKLTINGKTYNVLKPHKGFQLSKDGKKARITFTDDTTETITL